MMRRKGGSRRHWSWWMGIGAVMIALAGAAVLFTTAGFFDRDPTRFFQDRETGRPRFVAVLFSGDMGIHHGMGPYIGAALAKSGIPTLGLSSSTEFATHKTRSQVNAVVESAIRSALRKTGADQAIVLGQSYGADVARVGLSSLPQDLKSRVAAMVLVVPGSSAWFRADPTGLAYLEAPDEGPQSASRLNWAPLICIHGSLETDSLCTLMHGPNLRSVTLPGGHFLRRDHDLLVNTILRQLKPVIQS